MIIPLEDFMPTVFSAVFENEPGKRVHLLACRRRVFLGGLTDEKGKSAPLQQPGEEWVEIGGYHKVLFPAGIALGGTPKISFGIDGCDRKWTLLGPEAHGISDHAARAALAEIWKGVAECHATMNQLPFIRWDTQPMLGPKLNGRSFWSAIAWTKWDDWNKRGLNIPQRVDALKAMGFADVTAKDLENAKRAAGMPKTLKDTPHG